MDPSFLGSSQEPQNRELDEIVLVLAAVCRLQDAAIDAFMDQLEGAACSLRPELFEALC